MSSLNTNQRFPWSQLKRVFEGEWIELISYDWSWGTPRPRWGVVRHSATDRHSLMRMIERSGAVEGSLILFVGAVAGTVDHASSAAVSL